MRGDKEKQEEINKLIAEWVTENLAIMKAKGVSGQKIARNANLSHNLLIRAKQGGGASPETLLALAKQFGVSIENNVFRQKVGLPPIPEDDELIAEIVAEVDAMENPEDKELVRDYVKMIREKSERKAIGSRIVA